MMFVIIGDIKINGYTERIEWEERIEPLKQTQNQVIESISDRIKDLVHRTLTQPLLESLLNNRPFVADLNRVRARS